MAIERLGFRYYGRTWPKLRKKIRKEVSQHWWLYARVVPKARTVLGALRDEYRLGVIANQPPQVVDRLNQSGLLGLFDVVLLDSQYGVAKPDPALFRLAMEQARVDPEESLMVGDRLDNDVIPARRLGMRAVLLWLNVRDKGWTPQSEWERTFWGILERLPLPRWDDLPPNERPMALLRCWDEMPAALNKVWAIRV
jgi:HAD superfamily hydrolase (TIGR01549 family)